MNRQNKEIRQHLIELTSNNYYMELWRQEFVIGAIECTPSDFMIKIESYLKSDVNIKEFRRQIHAKDMTAWQILEVAAAEYAKIYMQSMWDFVPVKYRQINDEWESSCDITE